MTETKALTLRLPVEVHERLRRQAFEERVSMSALIVAALRADVLGEGQES